MLIVNEVEGKIYNLNNCDAIWVDEKGTISIASTDGTTTFTITKYGNKEESKKVLRDIWSKYANKERVFILP